MIFILDTLTLACLKSIALVKTKITLGGKHMSSYIYTNLIAHTRLNSIKCYIAIKFSIVIHNIKVTLISKQKHAFSTSFTIENIAYLALKSMIYISAFI